MAIDTEKLEKYFKLKLAAECGPHGLKAAIEDKMVPVNVVDVRSADLYKAGHVPGAVNIPLPELEKNWKGLNKKQRTYVYCYGPNCFTAVKAALFLAKKGFFVTEVLGGFDAWKKAEFPVQAKAPKAEKQPAPVAEKPELVAA